VHGKALLLIKENESEMLPKFLTNARVADMGRLCFAVVIGKKSKTCRNPVS